MTPENRFPENLDFSTLFAECDRTILDICTDEIFIHLTAWASGAQYERTGKPEQKSYHFFLHSYT
ncbi:MAG: hypothetical protein PX483_13470 [Nostocales cyanobacterium LE14-WE4]|nr:hypothetical protein [Nostocales cyanobacterium LE14-WE4]